MLGQGVISFWRKYTAQVSAVNRSEKRGEGCRGCVIRMLQCGWGGGGGVRVDVRKQEAP